MFFQETRQANVEHNVEGRRDLVNYQSNTFNVHRRKWALLLLLPLLGQAYSPPSQSCILVLRKCSPQHHLLRLRG